MDVKKSERMLKPARNGQSRRYIQGSKLLMGDHLGSVKLQLVAKYEKKIGGRLGDFEKF